MARRIAVVISQSQSQNPVKRGLEEEIVAQLLMEPGIDVTVVPNLYDLTADGTGILALQGIKGDMIVCSWLFERAAHWILDRNDVRGHLGQSMIQSDDQDEDDEEEAFADEQVDEKQRVSDQREIPNRKIYCLDLRIHEQASPYLEEIKRIANDTRVQVVDLGITPMNGRTATLPSSDESVAGNGSSHVGEASLPSDQTIAENQVNRVDESGARRWYPVIDYSRCTNCMECIDFCLFGVYGVDRIDTILVEQPDNCRKGCPACSRVCPENAIMFPQHKTPAIAGAADVAGGLKIDLSQLFGAPDAGKSALEVAAMERDEKLVEAGRDAVGMSVGIPKRQTAQSTEPKDELDDLLDQLDDMNL